MLPRFFIPDRLAPGATIELPAAAAHHALKVLRLGAGETAILFDGFGGQWQASLQPTGKTLRAHLQTFEERDLESPLDVTLVQALAAGDKMDWVVQKAVELGVTRIQPVQSKRSVVRLSGERLERRAEHWRSIAVAACEQSGRNRVPEVAPILDLPQYLGATVVAAQTDERWICVPESAPPAPRMRDLPPPQQPILLLVGAEGGFEDGELAMARAAGFRALSLGPRVLRTETAGLAALAAIMALWGDA
ncbi:MAG TPA: 16S rRNA (uracil(1498)-N(3))-methyltransferase [Rhodocyclaceae bacterium]|nr:16S rRNA (uracil(1498)-N(3))-methyltransferase [Rhodocyclaceae bacterium]